MVEASDFTQNVLKTYSGGGGVGAQSCCDSSWTVAHQAPLSMGFLK